MEVATPPPPPPPHPQMYCTFPSAHMQESAARAFDREIVRLEGIAAITNFSIKDYADDLDKL